MKRLLLVVAVVAVVAFILWASFGFAHQCDQRGGQVITGHQGALYCVPRVP